MIERPQLPAQRRVVAGKEVSRLRRQGIVPAVVYGHGEPSESIQVDARRFDELRRRVGRNALVDLRLDESRPRPVLVHGVQEHPVSRRVVHVDFFLVKMTEELTVDVPLVMTGTSEAADRMGGTLLHLTDQVKVKALPADLPQTVELDVTPLHSFDAVLHVRDIALPARVTLLTDPDEPVARVQPPRIEEEPVTAPGPAEGAAEVAEAVEETGDGSVAPEA